jgi:hydroxypyruvate isomerase
MSVKQSVCVPMVLGDVPLNRDLFIKIKNLGYEAVEFWNRENLGDFESIFRTIKDVGLEIATISGHNSLSDGMNNTDNHNRIEAELRDSIEVAARFGIPGLICFSGNRNGKESDVTGMKKCARILKKVAPLAEKAGVNLNMELLNSKVDHPGYQCDRSDWGVTLCEMVGSERIKLLYDIYHMQIMEGNIIETIEANWQYIGHFHTAGVPGRQDMDETQELNYAPIAQAIGKTGYPWFVGHEYKPKGEPWVSLEKTFTIFDR